MGGEAGFVAQKSIRFGLRVLLLFPLDNEIECRFLYQLALPPAPSIIPRRPESAWNPCTGRYRGWSTVCTTP